MAAKILGDVELALKTRQTDPMRPIRKALSGRSAMRTAISMPCPSIRTTLSRSSKRIQMFSSV